MGNPLAPPLAHLFMVQIEQTALGRALQIQRSFKFKPQTWLRYVDDIYARISKSDHDRLPQIQAFLNTIHKAIQFTSESEKSFWKFLAAQVFFKMEKNECIARQPIQNSVLSGNQRIHLLKSFQFSENLLLLCHDTKISLCVCICV